MKRLGVFPYQKECFPIVRHAELLRNTSLCALISPRGWGLVGQKVSLGSSHESINVVENLEDVIEKIDTLLIPNIFLAEAIEKRYIAQVCAFTPKLSDILCEMQLREENRCKLETACRQSGCNLTLAQDRKTDVDYGLYFYKNDNTALELIPVPVVVIAGLWQNTDKFEVSLLLREKLLADGFRVSQIGSRSYCELMGFHSFPRFMYNPTIDETGKIVLFNRYLQKVVREENPDILLLTIPGAIQGLNDRFPNGFGLLAYEVLKATSIDFLILCTFFETNTAEFLNLLNNVCQYKYGCPVNYFHMTDMFVNMSRSDEMEKVVTNYVSRDTVSEVLVKQKESLTLPIVNVFDFLGQKALYQGLLAHLTVQEQEPMY